ncbi:MAG: tetratricopeptide repeat protein, partial [Cytophagales bacterium]
MKVDKKVDRCLLLILGILLRCSLFAQNIDRLQTARSNIETKNYVDAIQILLNLESDDELNEYQQAELKLLLADAYEYFDFHDKALNYYKTSYEKFKSLNDSLGMAISLTKWGDLLEDRGEVEIALKGFWFSEKVFEKHRDTLNLVLLYNNISSAFETMQDYKKAESYLNKSFKLLNQKKDTALLIMTYNNFGDILRKQGLNVEAVKYYKKAVYLCEISNNEDQKRAALKDISRSFAEIGMFENAYKAHIEFFELNHKLKTKKKIDEVAQMQLSILELQTDNRLKVIEEEKEASKFRFVTTIIILLISSIVLLVLFLTYRFKTRKEKELSEAKSKLLEAEVEATKYKNQIIENELAVNKLKLEEYTQELINKGKESKREMIFFDSEDVEDEKMIKAIDELSKSHLLTNDDWTVFKDKFESVFPHFFTKLRETYSELSLGDLRLIALMKLRLKTEEIANLMGISNDSVKKAKFRLKKKIAPNDADFNMKTWVLDL